MIVALKAPHIPFSSPPRMAKRYENVIFPVPPTFDLDVARSKPGLQKNVLKARTWHTAIPAYGDFQAWVRAYTRCAMTIDDSVGRLLAALDASGAARNTLVIYTSDQGYSLGELGLCEKHYAYEQVMRVPMLVRFPQQPRPGSPPADLVCHLDVPATIMDLCVGQLPGSMLGRSWRELFEASGPKRPALRTEVFFDFWHPRDDFLPAMQAVRTASHKLIAYEYEPFEELYDLETDPHEANNLIEDPAHADVRAELEGRLAKWKRDTDWAPRIQAQIRSVYVAGPLSREEDAREGAALAAVGFDALVAGRAPRWRRLTAVDGLFQLGELQAAKRPEIVYVALALERLGPFDPFITLQLVGRLANSRFAPLAFAGFTGGERIWLNEGYARLGGRDARRATDRQQRLQPAARRRAQRRRAARPALAGHAAGLADHRHRSAREDPLGVAALERQHRAGGRSIAIGAIPARQRCEARVDLDGAKARKLQRRRERAVGDRRARARDEGAAVAQARIEDFEGDRQQRAVVRGERRICRQAEWGARRMQDARDREHHAQLGDALELANARAGEQDRRRSAADPDAAPRDTG